MAAVSSGWAPLKAAHVRPRAAPEGSAIQTSSAPSAAAAPTSSADAPHAKRPRARGQNHARTADEVGIRAGSGLQLCRWVAQGQPERCRFGPARCRDAHDIEAYLRDKPADLGPRCHVFDTKGACPAGLSCRFGRAHGAESGAGAGAGAGAGGARVPIFLIGTKADLASDRAVSEKERMAKARAWGCKSFEVSAKTNSGVAEVFEALVLEIVQGLGAEASKGSGGGSVLGAGMRPHGHVGLPVGPPSKRSACVIA